MTSHITQGCLDLVESFEGFTATAIWDYQQWSNGFGTKAKAPGETITRAEASNRLQSELNAVDQTLSSLIQNTNLSAAQWAALISAGYNLGTGKLVEHGIIDAVNRGDLSGAVSALSGLCHAGGKVLQGLVKRRNEECALLQGNTDTASLHMVNYSPDTAGTSQPNPIILASMDLGDERYGMGGDSTSGSGTIDCSHFVTHVLNKYLGIDLPYCTAQGLAQSLSEHSGGQIPCQHVTSLDENSIPAHAVISLNLKLRYPYHVVLVTTDDQGNRWVIESSVHRDANGKTGVQSRPLSEFLHTYRNILRSADIADISSEVMPYCGKNYINTSTQFEEIYNPWPDTDENKIKFLTTDTFKDTKTGVELGDSTLQLNGITFMLSLDAQNTTDHSKVIPQGDNAYMIQVANMTSNWSRFSVIQKMAETAHVDAGDLQIKIAEELIRTQGDDSYYRFLQQLPTGEHDPHNPQGLNYGFGSLRGKPIPDRDSLWAQHLGLSSTTSGDPAPPVYSNAPAATQTLDEARAAAARMGGTSVAFSQNSGMQGRISEEFDPRSTLAAAYDLLPEALQRQYSLTPDPNKTLLLPADADGNAMMPAGARSIPRSEVFPVYAGETAQDLAECIIGRNQIAQQAVLQQVTDPNANVVPFGKPPSAG